MKEYLKSIFLLLAKSSLWAFSAIGSAFGVPAILKALAPNVPLLANIESTIPTFIYWSVGIILLVAGIAKVYHDTRMEHIALKSEYERLTSAKLEILFEAREPYVLKMPGVHSELHENRVFRVGVMHTGKQTISNVTVTMESSRPQIWFLPVALRRKDANTDEEVIQKAFELNRGYEQLVDVFHQIASQQNPPAFVQAAVAGLGSGLEARRYRVILSAHGDNAEPCKREFVIATTKSGDWSFKPYKERKK